MTLPLVLTRFRRFSSNPVESMDAMGATLIRRKLVRTTYRHSWLGFLVAILMMPLAYGQGETVLVANFMNGNNSFLNSRVYLFNSSNTAGEITVRVFRLPLLSGFPQELTVAPLSLGSLGDK